VTVNDAGLITAVGDQSERPLWTVEEVTITPATHGTLISAGLTAAQQQQWAARLDQASAAVRATGLLPAASTWDGGLVVIVPSSPTAFTAATGANSADTAAVTSCDSGTPRITINPGSFVQGDRWLQSTLTHEAVHVATDSACTVGVGWVVEGMAESVAAGADQVTAAANARLVQASLAADGLPTSLPVTLTSPTDYALAQLAADQVRAHLGAAAPAFFERGVKDQLTASDLAQATDWYLAALRRLR
jgi:hypothetical protein